MNILLIEPDKILADSYCLALKKAGYFIEATTTAQQAMNAIDHKIPDMIIMELQLPGHNGIELLYELRSYADLQTIRVIVLTFAQLRLSDNQLKRLSVDRYLYKPQTSLRQLVNAISEVPVS